MPCRHKSDSITKMIPSVESYLYIKYLWENGEQMTGFPNGWAEAFVGYCFDHSMVQPSYETWAKEIPKWKTGC